MNSPLQGWGEIHPAEYAGWGGGPQRKRREIPPYAARRANNARKKKPGRSVRNDSVGLGGAGYPGLTAFVALRVRPEGLTYDCDAPPALQSGGELKLAAQGMGGSHSRRKRGMGRRSPREVQSKSPRAGRRRTEAAPGK